MKLELRGLAEELSVPAAFSRGACRVKFPSQLAAHRWVFPRKGDLSAHPQPPHCACAEAPSQLCG